jgi:hypothetical protein
MTSEIDLLLRADTQGHAVVNKDTNVWWSRDDLLEARGDGQFTGNDKFAEPDAHCPVTSVFPGCLQLGGKSPEWEEARPLAETEHFVIFALNGRGLAVYNV